MPTANNRTYTPYLFGEEVGISTYPDDLVVAECERQYSVLFWKTSLWYKDHVGVDLVGKWHAPVYAVADATVVDAVTWGEPTGAWGSATSGTYVALSINGCRGHEVVAIYKHLSERHLNKGDTVMKGRGVGLQGTTGNSTGEHLHFELWVDKRLVDPIPYIEDRKSFIIADPEPEVSNVNVAVDARYVYVDGGTQNIRAANSVKSAKVGTIANGAEFNVDTIADNEGYTWGHIPDVGWTVLYSGDKAWCLPVAKNDGAEEIAHLNGVIAYKDNEIAGLNDRINKAKQALG